jgi:hypothetical protein
MKPRNYRDIALRDESGAEMAELAFVMPLLFMLLFGIMWFGRAFQIYSTVNQAARAGAEAAVVPTCASCGDTFNIDPVSIKTTAVDPILRAAHLDPTQVQAFTLQVDQPLNPSSSPQEIGAIVSFKYPYSFKLNGVTCCPPAIVPITNGITFTAQAQARKEQ